MGTAMGKGNQYLSCSNKWERKVQCSWANTSFISLSSSSLLGRPFRAREGRQDEGMLGESTPHLCSQRCILGKPWSNSLQGMTGWDCLSSVSGQQVPPLVSLWLLEVLLLARSALDGGCWAVTCATWNLFPVLQHFLDKSYPTRLDFFI